MKRKIEIENQNLIERITESVISKIKNLSVSEEPLKYKVLNEARCWSEGCKLNSFPRIKSNPERMLLMSEGISYEPNADNKGGIIIFSTDVNSVNLSPNKLANWIKQRFETMKQRLLATKKVNKIAAEHDLRGWTIGKYLVGHYTDASGKHYDENSLCLELIDVDFDRLLAIAEDICKEFNQESVLLKDYSTNRVLFVNPD